MSYLPDEILLCIVQQFSTIATAHPSDFENWKTSVQTLANLCLTSKAMHTFAQPLLYQSFVKDFKTDLKEKGQGNDRNAMFRSPNRLEKFLRTLLKRPDLAKRVRCLRLQSFQDEDFLGYLRSGQPFLLQEMLKDQFVDASHRLPLVDLERPKQETSTRGFDGWQDEWRSDMRIGAPNAEITLLLTLVTGLEVLDISTSGIDFGEHFQMFWEQLLGSSSILEDGSPSIVGVPNYRFTNLVQHNTGALFMLPFLHTLILRDDTQNDVFDLSTCFNLMTIPTLRSFPVHGGFDGIETDLAKYHLPLQHLQDLLFKDIEIERSVMHSMIQGCTHLRSLELVLPSPADDIDIGQGFLDVLATRADTLERLQILIPDRHCDVVAANPYDLRRLVNLKFLKMSQYPLFPVPEPHILGPAFSDLLPPSLQTLTVRFVDKTFTNPLSTFSEANDHENFPNLTRFELVLADGPHTDKTSSRSDNIKWAAALDACVRTCGKQGIEFKISLEEADATTTLRQTS